LDANHDHTADDESPEAASIEDEANSLESENSSAAEDGANDSRRPGRKAAMLICSIALVIIATVSAVAFVMTRNTSEPANNDESETRAAIQVMVDRYNAGDFTYVKNNSCGELKIRALRDLGGLMDLNGSGAPSPSRYEIRSVSDFQYFSRSKEGVQVYANAEVKYASSRNPVNHVAYFALLRDGNRWNVCTAMLMSMFSSDQ
jgi:hypothetical protein